jgi:tetratricopeptide (TPR) repeat protein
MGNLESIGYADTRMGIHDDEALRFYLMALAIDPTHKAAWDNLIGVLHRLDKDEFIPRVQTLVSSPTEPNAAFVADSINEYFLHEKPDDYDLLVNKGLFQTRLLNEPMAREAFDKANKLRPDSPRVLIGYGLLYDAVGDSKKADEYFKRCTKSNPSQSMAWAMRGLIAEKAKNYKEALDNYVVASALSPEKGQWSAKIGVLDKIVKSGGMLKYEDAAQ